MIASHGIASHRFATQLAELMRPSVCVMSRKC